MRGYRILRYVVTGSRAEVMCGGKADGDIHGCLSINVVPAMLYTRLYMLVSLHASLWVGCSAFAVSGVY